MLTEAKLRKALREMMLSLPLKDITVRSLCDYCGIPRQTFYYHYADVYDLLNSIFLNEKVDGMSESQPPVVNLKALHEYAKANFPFLRSAYNSAGNDLVDDFFFSSIMKTCFSYYLKHPKENLTREGMRVACRRFARAVADEYGYCFRNQDVTPLRFDRLMNRYVSYAAESLFDAFVLATAEERKH